MAADGIERTLGNGLTRRFVNKADISSAVTIIPAIAGLKTRIVYGRITLGAASDFEVQQKTGSVKLTFDSPPSAGIFEIQKEDDIISLTNDDIEILGSAATTAKGFVDYTRGTNP